jgi:hypothetical protein
MVSAGLHTTASSSPDDASRRDSAERNNGAADYEVHADIVARIENTYNFDGKRQPPLYPSLPLPLHFPSLKLSESGRSRLVEQVSHGLLSIGGCC